MAAPTVTTDAATGYEPNGITLNGTLNADGGLTTQTKFEYGLTVAYGTVTTLTTTAVGAVSATVTALLPDTIYHFRVVGVNADGTTNGADATFVLMVREGIRSVYVGLSTDVKPTGIATGSRSYETNTGDWYMTQDGTTWTVDKRVR